MVKHARKTGKRALAICMSVLMLMTSWVFVAPTAFAATDALTTLPSSGNISGYYKVTSNTTISGSTSSPGLTVTGTTVIYIASGVTLTVTGANSSGATSGKAGIKTTGQTLIITGPGSLAVTGGNGGNGANGANGQSSETFTEGDGGNGGNGGGGGGAGIGGNGGNGGGGGAGGDDNNDSGRSGGDGSDGEAGGTVYILTSMPAGNISLTAGSNGTRGTGGSQGSSGSAAGGGGGGGGSGYGGAAIGGGGGGGGGGCGGAEGVKNVFNNQVGKGGPGGNGASNGTAGSGGSGHSVGSGGAKGTSGSNGTVHTREHDASTAPNDAKGTVTFNKNNGTGGTSSVTCTIGYAMTTGLTLPTRTGYDFAGYYTAASGGTQYYDANGNSAHVYDYKNLDLYAHWTPHVITTTLNKQNGSGGTSTVYHKYQQSGYYSNSDCTTSMSSITTPGRIGYIFDGYYSSTNGAGTQYITSAGAFSTTNNLYNVLGTNKAYTLYAKWNAKNVTVTFKNNDGTAWDSGTTHTGKYDKTQKDGNTTIYTLPSNNPTVVTDVTYNGVTYDSTDHWTFDKWVVYSAKQYSVASDTDNTQTNYTGNIGQDPLTAVLKGDTVFIATYKEVAHDYTGAVVSHNDGTHSWMCTKGCGTYGTPSGGKNATTSCDDTMVWTDLAAATCGHNGYQTGTCSVCNYTTQRSTLALVHSFTGTVRSRGADGHDWPCVNGCGTYGTPSNGVNTVAAHNWSWNVTQQPTCTTAGSRTRTCSVCGYSETEAIAPTGTHTGVHHDAKAATCQAAGNIEYWECSSCHKKFSNSACTTEITDGVTIAQKPHSYTGAYVSNNDGTHSRRCVNGCNQPGDPQTCSFGEWVDNTASCTAGGSKKHTCSLCGYEESQNTGATGHNMEIASSYQAATCAATGTKEIWHCTNCDLYFYNYAGTQQATDVTASNLNTKKVIEKDYSNHASNLTWVPQVDPTCTAAGTAGYYTCPSCNKKYSDAGVTEITTPASIASHGHNYIWSSATYGWNATHTTCTATAVCAYDQNHTDTVTVNATTSTTPATCLVAGATTYTANFNGQHGLENQTYMEVIPATGHNMDGSNVSYSWTQNGNTYTCTATETCANTGCTYSETRTGVVTKGATTATCTAAGTITYTATFPNTNVPNDTKTVSDSALGHSMTAVPAKTATCMETGNNLYYVCDRCGNVYKDENGNTATTVAAETIAKIPHDFSGVITSNGDGTHDIACAYGCGTTDTVNCTYNQNVASAEYKKQDADCMHAHQYYLSCQCGQSSEGDSNTYFEIGSALGHNLTDWAATTPATCTTDGEEERHCQRTGCTYSETRTVAAFGHNWNDWATTTPATCTADGVETRICKNNSSHTETRTIPATGHNWGAWSKDNEAGHTHSCQNSGCTENETQPHEWVDIVDPDALVNTSGNTCANGVSYYKTCSVCGRISNTQTFTTQAAGHQLVAVPAVAATCTEAGHEAYWQCAVCQKYFNNADGAAAHEISAPVVSNALGHNFVTTATPIEATGGHMYKCSRCNGYGFGNALGAVEAHTYDQQNRGNRYIAGTASDCGQTASYYYSCKCGAVGTTTFSDPGGTLNHNLTAHPLVAATCAEPGRIAYWECSRCHRLFSDANGTTEVSADALSIPKTTNHTWGDWEVKTAATCTADGLRQRECSVCHIVESETITATGHHFTSSTYMPSNNGKHRVKCQDCDVYGPEVACTDTTSTSTAADCTHKGTTTYTCRDCGGSWTVEGAYGDHNTTKTEAVAATCTAAGTLEFYTCSVCGKMFPDAAGAGTEYTVADLVVQPLGHALTQVAAVAATCTTGGNDAYYTCSRCGGLFRDALGRYEMERADEANTDALGHDWGAWDVTPATCEQAGQKIRECNRCHITEPETIPATGHDYGAWQADGETGHKRICANDNNHIDAAAHTWTNIVDPTKKVPGSECTTGIQYYCTCSVCGYTSTTVTFEVAASGHKTVKHEAVTPTCTTAGNTEYYECSVCGGFFSDENGTTPIDADSWVRAATGHDWDTDHPTWYWVKTDGGYAATVVFTCNNDSTHKQNVEATVTLDASSTTATCTTAGTAKWNAVAAFDGTNYTSSKTETTDQLGHLWGEWTVVNAATCEAAGSEQRTCQRDGCTESETRPIAQLEHKTVYVPAVAPTCTADGSIAHYECALCGNYFSDSQGETPLASIVDAALGHDFDETGTPVEHGDGHYYKCTRCDAYGFDGVVDATTAHVYDQQNNGAIYAKPGSVADCTNEGEFYYSCLCGKSEADDSHTFTAGGSLGHVLSAFPAVTATCKEDGHNAYWYCSRCGNYYKDANANQATTLAAETISHTTIAHTMPDTWTETVPATCTANGLESRVCTVCEVYTETQAIPALNHSFTSTTYQSYHNGTHSVKCIRCDVYGDPVDCALSKEIVTTTAADCTHLGTTTYRCTCCGYEWTEENTGVGPHSSTPTHHAAVPATCTTAGSIEYWTCEICGKKFSDAACTTEVTDVTVAALAHEGIAYVAADPADCTHDGVKAHYACPLCHKKFSDATASHEVNAADLNIPQLGHNFYGAIKDNEDGTHSFKCMRCNAYGNETAHTFDRPIVNDGAHVSDADCLNPAKYHYSCVCGAIDTTGTQGSFDSGVPTGHAYNTVDHWNWDETTTPFTATATLKCDHDNSHTIDRVATVTFTTDAPDCESAGTRHYTAIVTLDNGTTAKDDTKTETVPVVGHSLVKTEAKAATCTTAGNIEYYTCSVCGKIFSDAAGANEITGTTTIPASGHDWSTPTYTWSDDGKTCTAERACGRTGCGFTENEVATVSNGKIESAVKTPATCTEMGVTTYTATFENVAFTQQAKDVTDIAKVQHTLTKTDAVEATCQIPGYDAYWTCSVCHKIFSDANGDHEIDAVVSALDPDNHKTLVHYAKVDATCLANGNIEYWHCNDCGLNLVYNDEGKLVATTNTVITAGADYHRFTTHVSAKTPTCTQQGNVEYWTCSVCGKHFDGNNASANEIADVSIAANGHTFTHTAAVAATCTENGNKEYWYCSVCHQYFLGETPYAAEGVPFSQTVDTAPGHQPVSVDAITVDCETNGRKAYTYCSVCDAILTLEDVDVSLNGWTKTDDSDVYTIEALGHAYGEPTWVWAGNPTDGYTSATATFVCANSAEHDVVLTDDTLDINTIEPVHPDNGKTIYTATVTFNGTDYTDTKEVAIVEGHHPERVPAKEATCDAAGNLEYWICNDTDCGKLFLDANALVETTLADVTISALGHNWVNPTWSWTMNGDYYTGATLTFTCANDSTHKQTPEVTFSQVRTEPDCTTAGKIVYTATATFDGETYTDTKEVALAKSGHTLTKTAANPANCLEAGNIDYWTCTNDGCGKIFSDEDARYEITAADTVIPALGHTYNYAGTAYAWAADHSSCTATATCIRCTATDTETKASTNEVKIAATCEAQGIRIYTVDFTNVNFATQTFDEFIPAKGHGTAVPHDALAPTCDTAGYQAYWTCSDCGKMFSDEELTEPISNPTPVAATGHSWDYANAVYNWNDSREPYTCEATVTCLNDSHHTKKETASITAVTVDATCTANGQTTYTATFLGDTSIPTTSTVAVIPMLYHDFSESIDRAHVVDDTHHNYKCVRCDAYGIGSGETAAAGGSVECTFPDSWFVSENETCTEAGSEWRQCEFCSNRQTQEREASGHKVFEVAAQEATCVAIGNKAYSYCERCGLLLTVDGVSVESQNIKFNSAAAIDLYKTEAPLAHDLTATEAVSATCEEDGNIAYWTCSRCGKIFNVANPTADTAAITLADTVIPATKHDFSGAARHNDGEETHSFKCTKCEAYGIMVNGTPVKNGKEACYGGAADCENAATCARCGTAYGTKLGHNYILQSWTWTGYTSAVAHYVCSNNTTHTKDVTATVDKTDATVTCTEAGQNTYVATATFEDDGRTYTDTDTKTEVVNASGHNWDIENASYSWDANLNCTVTLHCLNNDAHVYTEIGKNTTTTTPAKCEETGNVHYVASFTIDNTLTSEHDETLAALGHKWGNPNWTWTGDDENGYTAAAVSFVCERDNDHTAAPEVTFDKTVVAPTCEKEGRTVYTATATLDGRTYKDTKLTIQPALGHDWAEPVFSWTGNSTDGYTAATALFACGNDEEHNQTLNCALTFVTDGATCTTPGTVTYTATVRFNGHTYTDTKTADVTQLGHDYRFVDFTWTGNDEDGYTAAVANFKCANDPLHTTTAEATVTTETVDAICEADGKITYMATVTFEGQEYTDAKIVVIPMLHHNWGDITYTWVKDGDQYKVTALRKCANNPNEHQQTETVTTTSETVASSGCESEGTLRYTATFHDPFTTQYKEEAVAVTGHTLVHTAYQDSTCTEPGNIEYWRCSVCGKIFENEIASATAFLGTDLAVTVIPAKGHDFVMEGDAMVVIDNEDGTHSFKCSRCDAYGAVINDVQTLKEDGGKIAHAYGAWTVVSEPTCMDVGEKKHVCEVCGNVETAPVGYADHVLYGISAKSPTCTTAGNEAYYFCQVCGKLFTDNTGATETTLEEVTLGATGHDFSGAIRNNGNGTHSYLCVNGCHTYGNPTSHVFDQQVESREYLRNYANCTEPNTYFKSCKCGEKGSDTFTKGEPAGHLMIDFPAQAATCLQAGHTPYSECSRCNYRVGYEVIGATGHGAYYYDEAKSGALSNGTMRWEAYSCENGCGDYYLKATVVSLDAQGNRVPNVNVRITSSNGTNISGKTDNNGELKVGTDYKTGLHPGTYTISLEYVRDGANYNTHGTVTIGANGKVTGSFGTLTPYGGNASGSTGGQPSGEFRCSMCDLNDSMKNKPIIGWFISIIHMYVHAISRIGK